MGKMKIKISIGTDQFENRLNSLMNCLKKIQQENNLKLTLVEINVDEINELKR